MMFGHKNSHLNFGFQPCSYYPVNGPCILAMHFKNELPHTVNPHLPLWHVHSSSACEQVADFFKHFLKIHYKLINAVPCCGKCILPKYESQLMCTYYYYYYVLSAISPCTTGLKALYNQSNCTGTAPTHK